MTIGYYANFNAINTMCVRVCVHTYFFEKLPLNICDISRLFCSFVAVLIPTPTNRVGRI